MNGTKKEGAGWGRFLAAALVLSLGLSARAWPAMFTGVEELDDPGYMLVLIRQFNAHGGLYTHVYSQYGPFFSEWNAGLSRVLGPPTQESARWVALAIWLVTALAGGALAFRLTRSVLFAALAQGFSFLMLKFLMVSPGHPISLSVLCIAALACALPLAAGEEAGGGGLPWRAGLAGVALGALGMIKINLGVFALAAVGTAWAFSTPRDRAGTALRWTAGALSCAMPVSLVRTAWEIQLRLGFVGLLVCTLLGTLLVMGRDRATLGWRAAGRLALGFLTGWGAVTAACLGGLLATGTRPADVLDGILLRPLRFADIFNENPAGVPLACAVSVVALAGALAWRFFRVDPGTPPPGERRVFETGARLGFLALMGLTLVMGKGYSWVMPFLWVAVLPLEPARDVAGSYTRRMLALLAATEYLSLYPVSGTQVIVPLTFGVLATILVAAQVWADLPARAAGGNDAASFHRLAAGGVALLLLGVFAVQTRLAWKTYRAAVPLNLPGSAWVRCDEAQAAKYAFLAENLRRQPSFLTLPGLNSLYGWTGLEAPTGYNCTENFALLTASEQATLVREARRNGPVALVYNPPQFAWWVSHHGRPVGPLVEFQRECQPLGSVLNYTLLRTPAAPPERGATPAPFTGCARLEEQGTGPDRQPTGRILVNAPIPPAAEAVLIDTAGTPLTGALQIAPAGDGSATGVVTVPDPGIFRAHPPDGVLLRLCDAQGQRLTTLPFFVSK